MGDKTFCDISGGDSSNVSRRLSQHDFFQEVNGGYCVNEFDFSDATERVLEEHFQNYFNHTDEQVKPLLASAYQDPISPQLTDVNDERKSCLSILVISKPLLRPNPQPKTDCKIQKAENFSQIQVPRK